MSLPNLLFFWRTAGDVRMRQILQDRTVDDTIVEALGDPRMLSQSGAVTWPNNADLAHDVMYGEIRANGYRDVPSD